MPPLPFPLSPISALLQHRPSHHPLILFRVDFSRADVRVAEQDAGVFRAEFLPDAGAERVANLVRRPIRNRRLILGLAGRGWQASWLAPRQPS